MTKWQSPPINWKQQRENFLQSYPLDRVGGINSNTGIAHAVQKDAIQNSLDARDENNPDDFRVKFCLDDLNNPSYMTITDEGTTGLTGKADLSAAELNRLGPDRWADERWSRFRAMGYHNPESSAIGARGQGKFIFIGASKSGKMIFDTIRADGVYRIGFWNTNKARPAMKSEEGAEAERFLKSHTDLDPLENVGTRVIILDPKPEVSDSFLGYLNEEMPSDMGRYISSTWWEALKNGREIKLMIGDDVKTVSPPSSYQQFRDDPDTFKEYERKTGLRGTFAGDFPGVSIDDFVLVWSEKSVPEELKGICVQRGEMTVERYLPSVFGAPKIMDDHVFGWTIMNREGDRLLKEDEMSQHYHINRPRGSLAQELFGSKGWVASQASLFADRLGYYPKGRKITERKAALIARINEFLRKAGYKRKVMRGGKSTRKVTGGKKITGRRLAAQVRIDYPSPDTRVEYGQKVSGVKTRVSNYLDRESDYELLFTLKRKFNSYRRDNEKTIQEIVHNGGTLGPKKRSRWYPSDSGMTFHFSRDWKEDTYVLDVLVKDPETGKELHELRKMIYLNTNPPPRGGILKDISVHPFNYPRNKLQYRIKEDTDRKFILHINDLHPLFLRHSDKKGEPTDDYVWECSLNAHLSRDLVKEGKLVERKGAEEIEALMDKDFEMFSKSVEEADKFRQKILFAALK